MNHRSTTWLTAMLAVSISAILAGCGSGDSGGSTSNNNNPAPGGTSGAATRPVPTASGNTASGDTLKIGLVASQNGDLKPWGDDSVKGTQLAVDEINAAGGVNGKKIELLIQDSGSKPEQGKSAAEKLIADGALGLLGEVASGITAQMAISAFEKGVPVVSIGATRTDITEKGSNIFRVCYIDDFQGPVMAKFAYEERGMRKMALMTDKSQPYSTGLSDSFRKEFVRLGGEIVDEQFYESKQTQFGGQLTNLKSKNPDGIFLSGYFNEVGPIARQAREQGIKAELFGGDGWDSAELIRNGGEGILGGFFCNHYNNEEDRPEVKEFLATWQKKYNSMPATTMGALAYDAAKLMMDALKRAKSPDSKSLTEAIEDTVDFPGVSGKITLKGKNGNPPKRALVCEVTAGGFKARKAYEYESVMGSK